MRRAAVRATLAASVHNTQPWRFVLGLTSLEVHADWSRQLRLADPRGRQLVISCGCALFNARVALAAAGFAAIVERYPDPMRPSLVARLRVGESAIDGLAIGGLDASIDRRRTNRRLFTDEPLPLPVTDMLVAIAIGAGVELLPILLPEHRAATETLSRHADDLESLDPTYGAEVRAWTSGVVDAVATGGGHTMLLLGAARDTPLAWLRAGEAFEHILLEITRQGYVASPLTKVIEIASTNRALREQLSLQIHPHVLMCVGRAPFTPASRRRRLVDMIEHLEA